MLRASKRWLEQAPEFVLACYDAPKYADRYTVLIGGSLQDRANPRTVQYIGMSESPTNPQGFSQWGEMPSHSRAACGKKVRWLDLPESIRAHVVARCS